MVQIFFLVLRRKFVNAFILFLILPISLLARQNKEDSLRTILSKSKDDLSRVSTLLLLSDLVGNTNPEKARQYGHQALHLAKAKGYDQETCKACNLLGSLFHLQSVYDSSFYYHRKALDLAGKNNFDKESILSLMGISENFMRQNKPDSSRHYLEAALKISGRLKDPSIEAGIYNNLGNVYLEEHNLTEALKQFIAAATMYENAHLSERGLSKAWVNIGNIEQIQGHSDKALDYTLRSLQLFKKSGTDSDIAYCQKLLGRIYRKQGALEKALQSYQEAVKIYDRLGDRRNAAETFHSTGNIYYDQRKFMQALQQYEKSLTIAKTISDRSEMAYAYSAIGYAWYELENPKKSINYFDSSMISARQIRNRYLVMDAYQLLSSIQEEQHNYKEALKLHQSFSNLKDSLNAEQNNQATEELETKYQNEKKQAEIELLQKDQQIKNATLRQQRTIQTSLVIAILLIIAIGSLLFNRYRLMQKTRQHAEAEQMRNHIARDLHDDIGSTLSSINIISQLALKENKPEHFSTHFQRIGEQSAKMMERMSDMIWSINSENDSLDKMVVRMKEFLVEILESKNIGYQLIGEETLNGIILDLEKRKSLFLIFKEAINNSAKYSNALSIDITLIKDRDQLHLTISDNGDGFDPILVKKGNGLRNMKERAKEINALFELNASSSKGTTIKLSISLHDRGIS